MGGVADPLTTSLFRFFPTT